MANLFSIKPISIITSPSAPQNRMFPTSSVSQLNKPQFSDESKFKELLEEERALRLQAEVKVRCRINTCIRIIGINLHASSLQIA